MATTSTPVRQGVVPPDELRYRLVRARDHAGINQREVAEALGISLRSVNRYEAGEPPKRAIVLGWAMATGVDAEWLEHGHTSGGTARYPGQYLAA